jgi:hypothetical protein
VLGHEAVGEIVKVGSAVRELTVGDRVCMEPGIPDPADRAAAIAQSERHVDRGRDAGTPDGRDAWECGDYDRPSAFSSAFRIVGCADFSDSEAIRALSRS